jgi:uncharacterized protein involved in outer membrane biogenesis
MKKLLIFIGAIVAVLVIGFLVLAFSLGSIVKNGVNRVGPEVTQSKVELGDARISPFSGQGTLSNLVIGNPQGWQSSHAFALREISVHVDPGSLRGDHVVVNSIVIDQPDIIYESRLTTSNLQDLMKNIQQAAGTEKKTETKDGKPVKIEVKSFRLQNAKITVMGAGAAATVDMPPVVLENLGTREGGLTPEQLTVAVMKEVTAQAVQAAARIAMEKGLLEKGLNRLLNNRNEAEQPKK